jgi:hypothetical protein
VSVEVSVGWADEGGPGFKMEHKAPKRPSAQFWEDVVWAGSVEVL